MPTRNKTETQRVIKMIDIYWLDLQRFDENISNAPRLEIAQNLTYEHFSITLLTGFRKQKLFLKNFHFKILFFKAVHHFGLFRLSLGINILLWLIKNLKKNDILIIPPQALWLSLLVKNLKKCKIILDVRTIPVEIHNLKQRVGYRIFWHIQFKFFVKIPDGYSFITDLLKKNIENEFNLRFCNYVLWHSGVNMNHFASVRHHLKKQNDNFIITYMGVVTQNRGIDRVIHAIARLKDEQREKVRFQIIGDGPYLNSLKEMSNELKICNKIIFNGHVPYESIPEHLGDTDIFICPLPDRPEWNVSSPIKVFEYLACAKPLILTPIVSHKNIIDDKEYIVWTKGDGIFDIQRAIEFACENRTRLSEKARKAPDFIRNKYEWKAQAQKFGNYLKSIYSQKV
jgi:glycosyltransferase involved in cell wall biosynthesis